jgi:dTMP kinase
VKANPLIVIEALDAGGSQTQTDWLVARLKKEKYQPVTWHFPQEDRATGRLIYDKFLLHKNKHPFSRREQALLYIQDFYSRLEDIEAAQYNNKKTPIVLDRYCTSTMAYQTIGLSGKARHKMLEWLNWLCYEDTPALPKPDAVIFIDTPVAISLQRLAGKKKDFFETKEKLTNIRRSYLMLARDEGWHILKGVNAKGEQRTREDIHEEIWQIMSGILKA